MSVIAYVETTPQIEDQTVYLALLHRVHDPDGEFTWAIVMATAGGHLCTAIYAENPVTLNWTSRNWMIESRAPGQWSPHTEPSLVCLFKVKTYSWPIEFGNACGQIDAEARHIIAHRTVSAERQGAAFSSRTFALDVLARAIPRVSGQLSRALERCASDAASDARNQARGTYPKRLMAPGWYKMFRLTMLEQVQVQAEPSDYFVRR
ncbi:hypothetical protein F4677DRAFT_461890 [Hypoxylon crocopeplum]|nr:hypothetical protein F4677DRAFT_461890 [Hypoxylon crocopeplum]